MIVRALSGVMNYTRFHFEAEEKLMREQAYPEYAAHKRQHDRMIRKTRELWEDLERGGRVLPGQVSRLLRDWLATHILEEDKRLGEYLSGNGPS